MDLHTLRHMLRQHPYKSYLTLVALFVAILLVIASITSLSPASTPTPEAATRNPFPAHASYARQYYVSPTGSDNNDGTSTDRPFYSIDKALSFADAGNTINLADGQYDQTISSIKDGRRGAPITLQGSKNAIIHGDERDARIIEIKHDYLTLSGFTVDGLIGEGTQKNDYRDKLIYAIGHTASKGVTGLKITNMTVQNAGGECIRLRYFATDNEVDHTIIKNCGVYDFKFEDGGKNGEGIYIGTAPEQRSDGKNPTSEIDISHDNHIHHNTIETHGNECVDIKEGSTNNLVEYNLCQQQQDKDSAGFDARGSGNTFRFNTSKNNKGAGIRLGGDTKTDGIQNNAYQNILANNDMGAIKIMRRPQGKLCANTITYDDHKLAQKYDDTALSQPCN